MDKKYEVSFRPINIFNEMKLIRGETRWSTFEERETKEMVKWMLRVVFEENLMSEIGRACLVEIGCKSIWWACCRHICSTFGLIEWVNLIWLRDASVNGMVSLSIVVVVCLPRHMEGMW